MSRRRSVALKTGAVMVAILALLGACYLHIRSTVCTTEIDRKLRNLSGLDFEIATTSCSDFGASVHTKISFRKAGLSSKHFCLSMIRSIGSVYRASACRPTIESSYRFREWLRCLQDDVGGEG